MRLEKQVEIDAAPATVFATYADVERWPEWTASVETVERLDLGPLRVGSRARLKQPRMPAQEWTVTELDDGRSFAWRTTGLGIVSTGIHVVEPSGQGSRVSAIVDMTGPLGGIAARIARSLILGYLRLETEGLKRRCES